MHDKFDEFDKKDKELHADNESINEFEPVKERIGELKLDTRVYINNKEHPLNLEQGRIIEKSHCHYRIVIISTNNAISGTKLWIPEHWIEPLPKELL